MTQTRLSGLLIRSGSIPVSAISGSFATASFAISASYALTASYVPGLPLFAFDGGTPSMEFVGGPNFNLGEVL
jgi:hypothetical protein